jgi:hypothetical protein
MIQAMKSNRRNRKRPADAPVFPTAAKGRWNPNENTRAQTYADRRKVADKRACRDRSAWN